MPRDLKALHREALERFKVTAIAEYKQRRRELEDLKFADPIQPDDQWSPEALESRRAMPANGALPPVPQRPALTINKLRQPLQQVQNQQRQARLALSFAPKGGAGTLDVAGAFEDIARAIQADSRANLARNWAFDRALRCGRGFYRIDTDYESERSFDQHIVYKRILNQFAVYFDPFCKEPDFSDARWCFVTEDLPWSVYKDLYDDSNLASYNDEQLVALGNERYTVEGYEVPGWTSSNDSGRTVRIAEYFFVEMQTKTLVAVQENGSLTAYPDDELPKNVQIVQRGGKRLTRSVELPQLLWAKMNGIEFLTESGLDTIQERDGRYIPIVPVIADESNLNGERRYTGMVRPALDAQRLFNVEASALAEAVHLGPVAPFIGYASHFQGYELWWGQLNSRRFPYLPVNEPENQFQAAKPFPERNTAEQPIQALVASLAQAENYVTATTNVNTAALGLYDPKETSGVAVQARKEQSDLATSGYTYSFSEMSLWLEGKILRDLIPRIYDRPGRQIAAQGNDDKRRMVLLNAPFVVNNGQPQQVPEGTPGAKTIDLKQGEYAVVPAVGKDFATKRQDANASIGALAQAIPEFVPAFADVWVENMDFPGSKQIAARLEKAVPPQFKDQQNQAQDPAALQAQIQQMQGVIQQLQPLADKNQADLMKVNAQKQADIQMAQMNNDVKVKIALIQALSSEAQAQAKIDAENARTFIDSEESKLSGLLDLHMKKLDQVHEAIQNARQQQHEKELSAQEHSQTLEQGDQQLQNTMATQSQQAALTPAPSNDGASA